MKKTKFQIKKEETFLRLIKEGNQVLLAKGFTKTSIEDIAKAAGYTRGAFYFHFESKEDFFIHVLKHHDALRGDWSQLPYQFDLKNTPLKEVLNQSIFSLWNDVYLKKPMSGWLLVYIEFYQSSMNDPSIKPQLKELHKYWEEDVAKFIEGLQDQGYISSSIDSNEAALKFIMTTYGFMVNYYIFDKTDIHLLIDSYIKIIS